MGDLKRLCPACESWSSAIGRAFRDGEPCPYCGLPADAAEAFDVAAKRGADEELARRMAEAERRAAAAERKAAELQAAVNQAQAAFRRVAEESARDEEARS